MKDDDYLYFDFVRGREFDVDTKRLIDQIANDPRFGWGPEGKAVAAEWAGEVEAQRYASIEAAAYGVFQATVGAELESQASVHIRRALADPSFDVLPPWGGEDPFDEYFRAAVPTDPRLRATIGMLLSRDAKFVQRQEAARRQVELNAKRIADELPQATRDALVLGTRNADREELLGVRIESPTSRRLSWTAYYVQRIVREREEDSVLNRYSAAAKTLAGEGMSKAKIARALRVSSSRVDRLLERDAWIELDAIDPLLAAIPELRAGGQPSDLFQPPGAGKPKAFYRMNIAEREVLAAETTDPAMLDRLVGQGSRRISEALLQRHVRVGDLTDDLLYAVLTHYPSPWMRAEFKAANAERALPPNTALELAVFEPLALLDVDDETATRASALGDERYAAILALRNADVDGLLRTVQLAEDAPAFQLLLQMLIERPLPAALLGSSRFIEGLLEASDLAADPDVTAALRLIACHDAGVLAAHVESATQTGSAGIDPQALVKVALGPYHRSAEDGRVSVRDIAATLWSSADLTVEHSLARTVIADRGEDRVVVRTRTNHYVVTPDAIRSYANADTTSYTYVHLHLTAARDRHLGDFVVRLPTSLPAIGYHREIGKHPLRPDGDDVPVIVWPLPLQPAIYSLDTSLSHVAGYVALSDGKVATIKDLD